jgi:hypothetical protein
MEGTAPQPDAPRREPPQRGVWASNFVPIILTAALAWIGSLVAATVAARYEFKAQVRDAESRLELQNRSDLDAFKLTAAQLVMGQPNCNLALKRAALLRALFPDQLGDKFAAPMQLSLGQYRVNKAGTKFIPLKDGSGCTVASTVPLDALPAGPTKLYTQAFGHGRFRTTGKYSSATVQG